MSEVAERYGVTYPVPLDNGFIAELRLPVNLSRTEADKIARVVATLPLPLAPAEEAG